jgi:hypothetical protein
MKQFPWTHAARPTSSIVRVPMRLRATSRLSHRHDSEGEAGAGGHSSTIPLGSEKVRILRQGTRAPHVRIVAQHVALAKLEKVVSH